jgi:small GTP-binding protein
MEINESNDIKTIVLLGNDIVGKTSLLFRYINNICPIDYDPTIKEQSYKIKINLENNEERVFNIIDTPNEETNIKDYSYYKLISNAHGFIIIFAIDDKKSFKNLKDYVTQIKLIDQNLPIILVGNKCDLEDKREILKNIANDYSNSIGAKYFEYSALTDDNKYCNEIFQKCAYDIISHKTL